MATKLPLTQMLAAVNLTVTKSRVAVLNVLVTHKEPLDVPQIRTELARLNVAVDQATVYRILDTFVKKNLVTRLEFQEGKFRFELVQKEHHHAVCEKCGRIVELPNCPINEIQTLFTKESKFKITRHALEFFGLCPKCQ